MAQQTIGLGAAPDDGNGDDLRTAGDKINDNFTELYNPACFKATKGGTNQTGVADSTETVVTFGTEVYDVGSHFASNAWTPPAGKISLTAQIYFTGTISAGALCIVTIYKNGVLFAYSQHGANANSGSMGVRIDDVANGTDTYEVRVYIDVGSGTATISGAADKTYFCGHWFSA